MFHEDSPLSHLPRKSILKSKTDSTESYQEYGRSPERRKSVQIKGNTPRESSSPCYYSRILGISLDKKNTSALSKENGHKVQKKTSPKKSTSTPFRTPTRSITSLRGTESSYESVALNSLGTETTESSTNEYFRTPVAGPSRDCSLTPSSLSKGRSARPLPRWFTHSPWEEDEPTEDEKRWSEMVRQHKLKLEGKACPSPAVARTENLSRFVLPVTRSDLLKGVIAYVEVRPDNLDCTDAVALQMKSLGATVRTKFYANVTHVVFCKGLFSTYKRAKERNIPMVGVSWIEECKRINAIAPVEKFLPNGIEIFQDPEYVPKYSRTYTLAHYEKLKKMRLRREEKLIEKEKEEKRKEKEAKKRAKKMEIKFVRSRLTEEDIWNCPLGRRIKKRMMFPDQKPSEHQSISDWSDLEDYLAEDFLSSQNVSKISNKTSSPLKSSPEKRIRKTPTSFDDTSLQKTPSKTRSTKNDASPLKSGIEKCSSPKKTPKRKPSLTQETPAKKTPRKSSKKTISSQECLYPNETPQRRPSLDKEIATKKTPHKQMSVKDDATPYKSPRNAASLQEFLTPKKTPQRRPPVIKTSRANTSLTLSTPLKTPTSQECVTSMNTPLRRLSVNGKMSPKRTVSTQIDSPSVRRVLESSCNSSNVIEEDIKAIKTTPYKNIFGPRNLDSLIDMPTNCVNPLEPKHDGMQPSSPKTPQRIHQVKSTNISIRSSPRRSSILSVSDIKETAIDTAKKSYPLNKANLILAPPKISDTPKFSASNNKKQKEVSSNVKNSTKDRKISDFFATLSKISDLSCAKKDFFVFQASKNLPVSNTPNEILPSSSRSLPSCSSPRPKTEVSLSDSALGRPSLSPSEPVKKKRRIMAPTSSLDTTLAQPESSNSVARISENISHPALDGNLSSNTKRDRHKTRVNKKKQITSSNDNSQVSSDSSKILSDTKNISKKLKNSRNSLPSSQKFMSQTLQYIDHAPDRTLKVERDILDSLDEQYEKSKKRRRSLYRPQEDLLDTIDDQEKEKSKINFNQSDTSINFDASSLRSKREKDQSRNSLMDFMTNDDTQRHLRKDSPKPYLVCTSMNASNLGMTQAAIDRLGGFTWTPNIRRGTTHVVCGMDRRTLNLLKGLTLGCWVLRIDWIIASLDHGRWLPEEEFVLKAYLPAVMICTKERESMGAWFQCGLLSDLGPYWVDPRCTVNVKDIRDLIRDCMGQLTRNPEDAKIIIGAPDTKKRFEGKIYLIDQWVLDSISHYCQQPMDKYLIHNIDSET